MHAIIESYLAQFSKEHSIEALPEKDRFEHFANYCLLTNRCAVRFELDDVITGPPEVGIDGVAMLIGDELIVTADDAQGIFSKRNRDIPVHYIFIQAKRSESFQRNALLNLASATRDVVDDSPRLPQDSRLSEAASIHKAVVANITKVRSGQPSCSLFYVTTGTWKEDPILAATRDQVIADLEATRYFHDVFCGFVDLDQLRREWIDTRAPSEAKFSVIREIPIPSMEGVSEALLLVTKARDFVDCVLTDENGKLKPSIFEQNVRHFLGEHNEVNEQIGATLRDPNKKHRFAILNNGITVVAREILRQASTVAIKDFQIVNGCQTSHVLFNCRDEIDDDVTLVVKAISASQPNVVDELVVATNSQTKVAESQFYAMKAEVRDIQAFFASFPGDDSDDRRLFFERRLGEFSGKDIAAVRIFDVHLLAKVFASMFLDAPHDALGSPRRVYEMEGLYSKGAIGIAYYTAAFAYYRFVLMLGNRQLDRADGILKWHALTALRYQTMGTLPITADTRAIELACNTLLERIWAPPKECLDLFQNAIRLVRDTPFSASRELRAKAYTDRLVAAASGEHRASQRRSTAKKTAAKKPR